MKTIPTKSSINKWVFYPPLILLVATVLFSLVDNDLFIKIISRANDWILQNFGWLFSWSSFVFLIILIITYFSPIAKVKIGGADAVPLLNKWRWFAISTCTTIATGILFWGCAEPLYHYASPPAGLQIANSSAGSMQFSLSTLYMHWSFTPYGIYCITGLVFALVYYNLKRPFRISSLLFPLFKNKKLNAQNNVLDVICLYSLVLGMSASLGAGILSMIGGLEQIFDIPKSNFMIAVVGLLIISCFIISAITGLQKGIKWLSTINICAFIFIAIYVFTLGYPGEVLSLAGVGLSDYFVNFVPRSVNIGSGIDTDWLNSWSIFYWANWFAWAPISSLFLGRIARGYTVRQYINFNLIIPSIFAIIWMTIFSGSTLYLNELLDNSLFTLMSESGEESVMYALLNELPMGRILSIFTLLIIFLSYVTAADSNISAMSSISSNELQASDGEAPTFIKIIWGLVIGGLTYVMLSTAGIDGIRILSVLGGFPALFIIILAALSLVKLLVNKEILGIFHFN
ncbi:MAG: glycine betaine transporter [Saprospiraceae bacterium]|jgi:glycine betaine transporter